MVLFSHRCRCLWCLFPSLQVLMMPSIHSGGAYSTTLSISTGAHGTLSITAGTMVLSIARRFMVPLWHPFFPSLQVLMVPSIHGCIRLMVHYICCLCALHSVLHAIMLLSKIAVSALWHLPSFVESLIATSTFAAGTS